MPTRAHERLSGHSLRLNACAALRTVAEKVDQETTIKAVLPQVMKK